MMEEQFAESIDKAIRKVVRDFQRDPSMYFNERDIHWNLFRYLKQEKMFQQKYVTELIRAEFPTCGKYGGGGGKRARGHYDLVVLQPDSLDTPAVREMSPWAPWDEYLPLVKVLVAVEVKMWWYRWQDLQGRLEWDIKKLTDSENGVKYPYLLNFVQLNFNRSQMKEYYHKLREYLIEQTAHYPKLKILCVPSDASIQSSRDNWISASK